MTAALTTAQARAMRLLTIAQLVRLERQRIGLEIVPPGRQLAKAALGLNPADLVTDDDLIRQLQEAAAEARGVE